MLQIVATMQVFIEPYMLTGGGPENATVTVAYLMYQYAFVYGGNYGAGSALGLMLMIVLLAVAASSARLTRERSSAMVRHHHRPEAAARTEAAARPAGAATGRSGAAAGRTAIPGPSSRHARAQVPLSRKIYWTLLTAVVIVFALVFVFPLYWMVTGAMKTGEESRPDAATLFPKSPDFGVFADAWTLRHRDAAQEHRLLRRRCLAVRARRGRLRRLRAVKQRPMRGT